MIAPWNRRELTVVRSMKEQKDITAALQAAGLDYAVRTMDRSSPGALRPGTRAEFGTAGMPAEVQYEYTIYVNREDYDAACAAAGIREIR